MVTGIIKPAHRVQAQTAREWMYEYIHGEPVWPSAWRSIPDGSYILVPDDFDPDLKAEPNVQSQLRVRVRI